MIRYDMSQMAIDLELPPRFFVTRDKGELGAVQLLNVLRTVPEEDALVLQFPPNQIIDVSFADETIIQIGQAIVEGQYGRRRLLLDGLTQDSIDNINAAIRLQRLKLAFLAILSGRDWKIVGHLENSLREVLNLISSRPSLTAPELADELDLALNNANNRLKRLYDQRLIRRDYEVSEKGLIYIYQFWHWKESE